MTFTSIFPAAYSGRRPHIHFEACPTLDAATNAGNLTTGFTADLTVAVSGYGSGCAMMIGDENAGCAPATRALP